MATASRAFRALAARSASELETVLAAGATPEIPSLIGYEFRGFNHARAASALRIRKFVKGFFAVGPSCFGFNSPARQNGLDGVWEARPDDAHPRRYAFFAVAPVEPGGRDSRYGRALLLDYGQGVTRALDPARRLRDYLVRVEPGSDDLLLGKAYLALGSRRAPLGYFLLERHRPFEIDSGLARHVRNTEQ